MNPEDSLELDLTEDQYINNPVQERIGKLTSKLKTAGEETAAERQAREAAEARAEAAEKKAEFLDAFSDVSAKHPGASEYKDAIQEKVLAGYSVEDATVSVLNAEGKLMPQGEIAPQVESPLGGSATNPSFSTDGKSVGEMTREEKRAALLEADKRGEIAEALKRF